MWKKVASSTRVRAPRRSETTTNVAFAQRVEDPVSAVSTATCAVVGLDGAGLDTYRTRFDAHGRLTAYSCQHMHETVKTEVSPSRTVVNPWSLLISLEDGAVRRRRRSSLRALRRHTLFLALQALNRWKRTSKFDEFTANLKKCALKLELDVIGCQEGHSGPAVDITQGLKETPAMGFQTSQCPQRPVLRRHLRRLRRSDEQNLARRPTWQRYPRSLSAGAPH